MGQKFCQSCGMPPESVEVMATNADQSKNEDYCVYCYKDGAFTQDVTMEEMIDTSLKHMKELFAGDPKFNEKEAADNMNEFFPKLKRWQS